MRGRLAPYSLMLALLVISLILAIIKPQFRTQTNVINVARQVSVNGIMAVGVTYVLLTGGVDLSLGSVLALAGVMAASYAHPGGAPVFVPILIGIGAGMVCGLVNGVLVTKGRVAPFIATLGMMVAARGLTLRSSGGRPVSDLSDSFNAIGGGAWGPIPYPVLIFIAMAIVSYVILRHMRIGRYIYAVGGSEPAANASGVSVGMVKMFAYGICGACAGLGGVVLASRATAGTPTAGAGAELDAIAAAVIGGTSLSGGIGSVCGTVLGVLLLGIINNGQDLLGVSSYNQDIIKGCIIVAAVLLDQQAARGSRI